MGNRTPPDGSSTSLVAHLDLLASAHRVQSAAVADDRSALLAAVERLDLELRQHLDDEQELLDRLPPAVGDLVRRGQERLVELVEAIGQAARSDRRCSCLGRSAELAASLRRQAAVEAAAAVHERATRTRYQRGGDPAAT